MDDAYFKKVMTTIILAALIVLSFFLLKPILMSIIVGIILAFVFTPVYTYIKKFVKFEDLAASIVCVILLMIIVIPLWLFTPILIDQSLKVYFLAQDIDFVTPLKAIFPSFFASEEFSAQVGSILFSFVNRTLSSLLNSFSNLILNFPTLSLQFVVALFTFFFVLRDQEKFIGYIQSLLPFSKDVEKKLFESSKSITSSVLYGQVIIGFLQGIIVGIGFFLFGVSNALLLTFLACMAGIFPIIGTTIVWFPVVIYLFVAGKTFAAAGLFLFGLIATFLDNFVRPLIVSQKTSLPSSIVLIGMVGGFFLFGLLGFILGPLILAYLIIIIEIYRNKRVPGILIQEKKE